MHAIEEKLPAQEDQLIFFLFVLFCCQLTSSGAVQDDDQVLKKAGHVWPED